MMEDLQYKFKNIDGVFEKLNQIERMLGTLMSRQMEGQRERKNGKKIFGKPEAYENFFNRSL